MYLQMLADINKKLAEVNSRLERKVTELSFLYEVATNLMKSYDLTNLLESVLNMALKITGSEAGCILLPDILPADRFRIKLDTGDLVPAVKAYFNQGCPFLTRLINKPEITTLRDGDKAFFTVRHLDVSLRSLLAVPLQLENELIGIILIMHRHTGHDEHHIEYSEDDRRVISVFAQQAALILENTGLKIERTRKDMYLKTISALTSAIDAKDVYTRNHSRRVAEFSIALAKELHLSGEELENIRYGAILHDIGKIGVNEAVLNKKGKLAPEEFALIKAHPVIGVKILQSVDFSKEILDIVRHHHERYDGTGYPDGLKGEAIPYAARIVAVADAWDAMIFGRSYRRALSYQEAAAELGRGTGTQFDPYMVKKWCEKIKNGIDNNNILG